MSEINTTEKNEQEKILTPLKAIRARCLDCCCFNPNEVRLCTCTKCALYPYRFGKNPYKKPLERTPEQLAKMEQHMAKMRAAQKRSKAENS